MNKLFVTTLIASAGLFATTSVNAECVSSDCKSLESYSYSYSSTDELATDKPFSIGVGVKGGDNNVGVVGTAQVAELSDTSALSIRTEAYFDDDRQPELRPSLTLDGKFNDKLTGYIGGGADIDFEGDDEVQGLVTGGLEYDATDNIVVGAGVDYLTDDDEFEGKASVRFKF